MDDIHLSVERSGFSVAVLLDFSKAFDSMVHGLLLWMFGSRIRCWSVDNSLVLNLSKTQAILISRRDRGVIVEHPLTVAGVVVVFSDSVKNLGLYIDNRLNWREQVSRVVSRTYSTLRLFYRFQRYTSRDLRIYLVRSLIIHIFLYSHVVDF
jgi:hypothetical protein